MSDRTHEQHALRVHIARRATLPDPVKLARYEKSPELGPRVLFFSGGSALRGLSREIIRYTYNSIHIITPFDSGGSSAKLRTAFDMPAIGDVRNRLMALADQSLHGNPEIFALFAHRFPLDAPQEELLHELARMQRGEHPLVAGVPDPMHHIIRHYLSTFLRRMPDTFDLRGASIGNLVLTAGYLENNRQMSPVIYIFSKLVQVRGEVHPVLNGSLHLAARLANGETLLGQHRITGKETPPPASPITGVHLTATPEDPTPIAASAPDNILALIRDAELICYPMGSFYSSLMANLLPQGIGRAILDAECPKIFIPNMGNDPESRTLSVAEETRRLLTELRRDTAPDTPADRLLNLVLVDGHAGQYPGGIDAQSLEHLGVRVVDAPLVTTASAPLIAPERLAPLLLSLT
ncbi:CofD-related protein of GAK system [Desulfobaculum xiamenense]|uniref:CofD-related protein of GAK system n=1 Tax=Desulfobaculum xiamenense TaxID=995050 RepID=A0A846QN14_9BACT|nr:GAK system CofD-like protein [Desulfobaculum xiamenense]NJB69518.1 CofD-related protein of GAK system [Desulfobaculum xiamenense]